MAHKIISLEDIYNAIGESDTKKMLNEFKCDLNKDIEYFLKVRAIEFFKKRIAQTFIVTSSYKGEEVIVGYFAISIKTNKFKSFSLSRKMKNRFLRFARYEKESKSYIISLPLIGQLGKNYNNNYNELISGDILLKMACDKILELTKIAGGRFVYLECEDKPKLKEFYVNNGFVCFAKRNLERDERENNSGEYLLQMHCDLNKSESNQKNKYNTDVHIYS